MTASERARELVHRNEGAAMTFWETQTVPNYETVKQTRAALLAYVARLEACVDAARVMANAVYAPSLTNDVKAALAALDRPEDGESE